MTAVLFVFAAGVGATLRFGAARAAVARWSVTWPATLGVNVVGSLALGWLVGARPSDATAAVVGTGLLGSFTTYSAFALEAADGPVIRRMALVMANVLLALGAAAAGYALSS